MPILKLNQFFWSRSTHHLPREARRCASFHTRSVEFFPLPCSPPKNCNTLSKKKAPVLDFCMTIRSIRKTNLRRDRTNLKPYSFRLSFSIGQRNSDEVDFYLLVLSMYQAYLSQKGR